jgi:hypothetical protein
VSAPSHAVDDLLASFQAEIEQTLARAGVVIRMLAGELQTNTASIDAVWWEQIEAMKTALGADAANTCTDDPLEQQRAISAVEGWVADHISQADHETWMAAVLVMNGDLEGEQIVRGCLAPNLTAPQP